MGSEAADLSDENARLARKVALLEKQMRRLDKMAEAADLVHRRLFEELTTTSARLEQRTTELARASEEARLARAAAELANEAKSEFLANMSHELRTPLNAIIGYSEMLAEQMEDEGNAAAGADLAKIRAAGQHLLAVISGILDLSKIEAGKVSLYLETFSAVSLVAEVEAMVAPLVAENRNQLTVRVADAVTTIHADATKLRQTLFNLLSNATKFTKEGVITLDVYPHPYGDPAIDALAFRVTDSGIGITRDQLVKLFRPFTQADSSTSRKYGGSGLGLAISRNFCRLMGGDLTATSEPGAGSTFTAVIPLRVREPSTSTRG